jgi:hypothetical protein
MHICAQHTPHHGCSALAHVLPSCAPAHLPTAACSEAYGVLAADGVALRGLFIIDKEGVIQHSTINNLAFGRNVDETLRVLQVRRWLGGTASSSSSSSACRH